MRNGVKEIEQAWELLTIIYEDHPKLAYARALMHKKNKDYAGSNELESFFDNFEISGALCFRSPEESMQHLINTKVARLANLLNWKKHSESIRVPENEDIEDSIFDGINYTIILWAYVENQLKVVKDNDLPVWMLSSKLPSTSAVSIETFYIEQLERLLRVPFPDLVQASLQLTMMMEEFDDWNTQNVYRVVGACQRVIDEFVQLYETSFANPS